jgi:hypothetical protein
MIVTTGKHIRIEAASSSIILERTAETPGCVTVSIRKTGERIKLPANKSESEDFIAAYRRTIAEDISYREQDCEFAERCPRCGSVDCAKDDIDIEPII